MIILLLSILFFSMKSSKNWKDESLGLINNNRYWNFWQQSYSSKLNDEKIYLGSLSFIMGDLGWFKRHY